MSGFERLDRLSLPWRTRLRARGPAEWQLPARLQDEGNDRGLEAHKSLRRRSLGDRSAKPLTSIPAMPTVLLLLRVEVTQRLPKQTKTANLSLNPISRVANP